MTDFNLVLSQVRQRLEILYQIVDELEAQGGGGSGGTDNYNDLSNKPQINGHTLTGNKTGSSLGLASTSDLEAYLTSSEAAATYQTLAGMSDYLTESDAASTYQTQAGMSDYLTTSDAASTYQTQAGMSSYYTKTETDSEIASEIVGAINDLDVGAVGGSTKYLTTISEANGLIDASAESPDTVPTTDSSKLITSGGVKTYVDNGLLTKISLDDILGQGTRIQNADMNSYWQPGNYYINSADDLPNITNKPDPVVSARARILVLQFTGTSANNYRSVQIWIPQILGTATAVYYMRYRTTNSQGVVSWTAWRPFAETTANMGMGINPYISEDTTGINFNDYITAGVYIKQYATNVGTFLNSPFDGTTYPAAAFKLIVEYINSPNNIRQTLIPLYSSNTYFIRTRMTGASGTWQDWYCFSGTQIPTINPSPQLSMSNELRTVNAELTVEPDEDETQDER